jgi:hypothetical protein
MGLILLLCRTVLFCLWGQQRFVSGWFGSGLVCPFRGEERIVLVG